MTLKDLGEDDIMPDQMALRAEVDDSILLPLSGAPLPGECIENLKVAAGNTFEHEAFSSLRGALLSWLERSAAGVPSQNVPYYGLLPLFHKGLVEGGGVENQHANYYAAWYISQLFHDAGYKGIMREDVGHVLIFMPEDVPDLYLHCIGKAGGPANLPAAVKVGDLIVPCAGTALVQGAEPDGVTPVAGSGCDLEM